MLAESLQCFPISAHSPRRIEHGAIGHQAHETIRLCHRVQITALLAIPEVRVRSETQRILPICVALLPPNLVQHAHAQRQLVLIVGELQPRVGPLLPKVGVEGQRLNALLLLKSSPPRRSR